MPIRFKAIIVLFLFSVFPMIILTQLMWTYTQGVLKDKVLEVEQKLFETNLSEIQLDINQQKALVKGISKFPPISGMLRAEETGIDTEEGVTYEFWQDRLATIYSSLIEANPTLLQLRYLDSSGQEIVRVNNELNVAVRLVDEELQDKSSSDYFIKSKSISPGSVYVGNIDINRELGEIEYPIKLVIRILAPIYNEAGEYKGVIISNIDVEKEMKNLLFGEEDIVKGTYGFLLDSEGYYIFHPRANLNFSKVLNPTQNYFLVEPELKENLQKYEEFVVHDTKANEYRLWKKVYLNENEDYIVYVDVVKDKNLFSEFNKLQQLLIIFYVSGTIVIIMGFSVLSSHLITPLTFLSDVTNKVTKNFAQKAIIPEEYLSRKDEIGKLARSFNSMIVEIQKQDKIVRDEVAAKTKEIQARNEQLERVNRLMFNREVAISKLKKKIESENGSN